MVCQCLQAGFRSLLAVAQALSAMLAILFLHVTQFSFMHACVSYTSGMLHWPAAAALLQNIAETGEVACISVLSAIGLIELVMTGND